jgi:dihydrofolate reductase
MRKLVESTFVTLDGVISSPEKWGPPYWDDEHDKYAHDLLWASDALLLGRETYEGFAEAWPPMTGDDYADRINSLPKYVASTTLQETKWNATLIRGDVADEVAKLKQQAGQNILKFGTGELDRTLMEHNLIDEYHFWLFPVVAGSGQHLLDGIGSTHLNLLDTTRFSSGIVVLTYTPK